MRKYPLSKKAMVLALAVSLAVTPFATLSTDSGDSKVYAEEINAADASSLAGTVTGIYQDFLSAGGNDQALKDMTGTLSNLDEAQWKTILGESVYGAMNQDDNDLSKELYIILNDLVGVFEPGEDPAFETRLNEFVDNHDADFVKVFEVNVTDFISLLEAIISELNGTTFTFDDAQDHTELSLDDIVDKFLDVLDGMENDTYISMRKTLATDYDFGRDEMQAATVRMLNASGEDTNTVADVVTELLTQMGVDIDYDTQPPPPPPPSEPDPEPVDDEDTEVEEDGTVTIGGDVTTVERTTDDATGVTSVRVTVNTENLTNSLSDIEEVREVRLNVTRGDNEQMEVDMPSSALQVVKDRNPNANIVIESNDGSISVPASQIDTDQLRTNLGGSGDDEVTISFSSNPSSDDGDALGTNNLTSRSQVLQFRVSASIGENRVDLNRFTRPIERSIRSSNGDFEDGTTVVVRINEDGTVTAVPTRVSGDSANFKGFSNSRYVAIESQSSFTDINEDYWAETSIHKLGNQRIILGYEDGEFRPTNLTTRAEFTAMLTRSLGLTSDGYDGEFTDITADYRFADDLAVAFEYGIVSGFLDGEFKPDQEIDRESVAAILSRATEIMDVDFELNEDLSADDFVDSNQIGAFAFEHVEFLKQAGIMVGNTNGTVRPKDDTSRSETAALLERFLVQSDFLNE